MGKRNYPIGGNKFSSDNQPSDESRERGLKKRQQRTLLGAILGCHVKGDSKVAAKIVELLPHLVNEDGYVEIHDLLDARLVIQGLMSRNPVPAIKEIYDRRYGKAVQPLRLDDEQLTELTREELMEKINNLRQKRTTLMMNENGKFIGVITEEEE